MEEDEEGITRSGKTTAEEESTVGHMIRSWHTPVVFPIPARRPPSNPPGCLFSYNHHFASSHNSYSLWAYPCN